MRESTTVRTKPVSGKTSPFFKGWGMNTCKNWTLSHTSPPSPRSTGLPLSDLLSLALVQSSISVQKDSSKSYQTRHTDAYAFSSGENERANSICWVLVTLLTTLVSGSEHSERTNLNRPEGPCASLRLPLTHLFLPSFSDCSSWRRRKSIPFLNVFLVAQITVSWGTSQEVPSGLKMVVILGQYVTGPEWN